MAKDPTHQNPPEQQTITPCPPRPAPSTVTRVHTLKLPTFDEEWLEAL